MKTAVASQQWYPNTLGATAGATISYHQQNGGLPSMMSSTLCHECWTHWKKYGGPRTATTDKKVVGGRGESVSGDEGIFIIISKLSKLYKSNISMKLILL